MVFKQPGDFIANRMYGDHPGSWSQTMQVGPLTLLRIKSTFGEPSWFSAAVIPYFCLALEYRRRLLAIALLFCIVFSTSTSAFVGFTFAIIFYGVLKRKPNFSLVVAALLFAAAFAALYFLFPDTFHEMFVAKLRGENLSGQAPTGDTRQRRADTEGTLTFLNRLFGIGFRLSLWRRLFCDPHEHGVDWHGSILLTRFSSLSSCCQQIAAASLSRSHWRPFFSSFTFLFLNCFCRRPGCFLGWRTGSLTRVGLRWLGNRSGHRRRLKLFPNLSRRRRANWRDVTVQATWHRHASARGCVAIASADQSHS